MGRKKKIETEPPAPKTYVCEHCGNEVELGHPCSCKEGRKEFVRKLVERHYGRRRKSFE